jgi:hypothetical protein
MEDNCGRIEGQGQVRFDALANRSVRMLYQPNPAALGVRITLKTATGTGLEKCGIRV